MQSKERVLRAINRQETDRIPFGMFATFGDNEDRICRELGIATRDEMYRRLGIDVWCAPWLRHVGPQRTYQGEPADMWGVVRAENEGNSGPSCPLRDVSTVDEVEAYAWPSADDFDATEFCQALDTHSDFAIIGGVWAPLFHNVTWLCGFETTMMNLVTQPEVSEALIRRVTDFWVVYTRKVLELSNGRTDIIENCNDFGAQDGMLMSPELFRRFFKPALKRLYDVIKEFDVKVMQHSCGSIVPILPDLVEMGVDILNPVQVSAAGMDIQYLKDAIGDKVTFFGGIDTQHVLPNGPVEKIREVTRRTIDVLGKGGGYILSASQGLEPDIPVAHIQAMFDEGREPCRG